MIQARESNGIDAAYCHDALVITRLPTYNQHQPLRGAGGPPSGPHGRVRGHAAPNPPLSLSPLKGQGAGALGIPFFSCLFQDQFLLPSCPDHRGKSDVWLASPRPAPAARILGELCLPAFTSAPSRELEVPPKCLCGGERGNGASAPVPVAFALPPAFCL